MIQYLKSITSDLAFYGVILGFSRGISILVMPIVINILGRQYGNYDALIVLITFIVIFGLLGQQAALTRYFFERKNKVYQSLVISTSFYINILASIVFLFIYMGINRFVIGGYLPSNFPFNPLPYVLTGVPSIVIFQTCQNIFRLQFNKIAYGILSIGQVLFFFTAILLPISHSFKSILLCYIGSYFIFSVVGIFFLAKHLVFRINKSLSLELLEFGIPYFLISLSLTFTPLVERWAITFLYNDEKTLSIYAVGARIAMLIGVILQSFQVAWSAFAYSLINKENVSSIFSLIFNLYSMGITIFVLGIVLFRDIVFRFLAPEYLGTLSELLILPFMFAFTFNSLSMISGLGIDLAKKTIRNLYIFLFSTFVTISLIFILGSNFNILGIALAVLMGKAVLWLLKNYVGNHYSSIRFNIQYAFLPIILSIVISVISYKYDFDLIYKFLLLSLFIVINSFYAYFLYQKWKNNIA